MFASRSTLIVALVIGPGGGVAAASSPVDTSRVERAILEVAASRLGPGVEIEVAVGQVRIIETAGPLVALPDQGAKVGQPARFALYADRRRLRVGEATAIVTATANVVRLRRALVRGDMFSEGDVEAVRGRVEGVRFATPPTVQAVIGSRASHDIAAGTTLTSADLLAEAVVKPGDRVRAVVRMSPGLEVTGIAVALQAGDRHEVIPVMNPETRQTRRARVVGPGEVEMIDAR